MLEQILVVPEVRIVVMDKIEQAANRPPKYLVDFCGNVELMTEAELEGWRRYAYKERDLQMVALAARAMYP